MLLLLGTTLFGMLLSLIYGWVTEFLCIRLLKLDEHHGLHFSITVLIGLATLSGLLGIWSLFAGVSARALAFFSVLAILSLIVIGKYARTRIGIIGEQLKSVSALSWLALGVLFIYVYYLAASSYYFYDTGLYHAQAIEWIEKYRAVPGLANLHFRLGFNSSLFLLSAFWGLVRLGLHLYQIPGLIIFVSMALYCFYLIEQSRLVSSVRLSWILAAGLVFLLVSRSDILEWLSSPMTDLPSAMITWVILLLLMEKIEARNLESLDYPALAITILALFAITLKTSVIPVLLTPLALIWIAHRSIRFRQLVVLSTSSLLVIVPWMARTVVLTGYLLFPFASIDVLHVDWKVPIQKVQSVTVAIVGSARIPEAIPSSVMSLKLNQWMPVWYLQQEGADRFILQAILVGSISLAIYVLLRGHYRETIRRYGLVYSIAVIGVVFWLAQAPSVRFGYGFLIPLLILVFYAPLIVALLRSAAEFSEVVTRWLPPAVVMSLLAFLLGLLIQFRSDLWKYYLFYDRQYQRTPVQSVEIQGQAIYSPQTGDQCWYDAFPCTPEISPGLALRGTTLQDGFYIKGK